MIEGVPIRVVIGLRPNGHADHPNWNELPLARAGTRPEEHQIVKWKYDKQCGHDDDEPGSPRGVQIGMMIVTQQYADEAVATFPGIVTIMTEAEAEAFWDNRAHAHLPVEKVDSDVLVGLKAKRDLMKDLGRSTDSVDAVIARALDPDDPEPGVRKTKDKRCKDALAKMGVAIVKKNRPAG